MKLRPAQEEVLKYRNGKLAVSAVPGSGKTFTLALLAAELISRQLVEVEGGQSILIVTYLNTSVDNFRAGIRRRLKQLGLPMSGFDVRTLHSLALEIVQMVEDGFVGANSSRTILSEAQRSRYLSEAIGRFISSNPDIWKRFVSSCGIQDPFQLRTIVTRTASPFIKEAKNKRYDSEPILDHLTASDQDSNELLWLLILAEIYKRYQNSLRRNGSYDFDDLIWLAVDLVEKRDDIKFVLSSRWPYVLEDEAQDSVPLQERLLDQITSISGNWVRVGDPNQAITSSFTSSHPKYFNAFCELSEVDAISLPNSGRSAPLILNSANALVHWACQHHPIEQVRKKAFREQYILPVPAGDDQKNPEDAEAAIEINVFSSLEDHELPRVAYLARKYLRENPSQTAAILVPTNRIGLLTSDILNEIQAPYDDLLRTKGNVQRVFSAITSILSLIADPIQNRYLIETFDIYLEITNRALLSNKKELNRFHTLIRSISRSEVFIYPSQDGIRNAFPPGVVNDLELATLSDFSHYIQRFFLLRSLPIGDLVLALGELLYSNSQHVFKNSDQTVITHISNAIVSWLDHSPQWRLPEIVIQLQDLTSSYYFLPNLSVQKEGYEPKPGVVTLCTQHGAKGLEWDAVFIVGLDSHWLPNSLEDHFIGEIPALNGDPVAETTTMLNYIMLEKEISDSSSGATEAAHIEVICERLRLFYVGITRAKRFLHLSRSQQVTSYNKPQNRDPSKAMEVIYRFLADYERIG